MASQNATVCPGDRQPSVGHPHLHRVHSAPVARRGRRAWRDYYAAWPDLTREALPPDLLELVPPLKALVPPAHQLDKTANSAFSQPGFATALHRRGVTTLVVTGGETDVCVLATVMSAVDFGFRVVLPTDALCSTSDATHDALLKLYRERFSQQIEATTTEDVLRRWVSGRG